MTSISLFRHFIIIVSMVIVIDAHAASNIRLQQISPDEGLTQASVTAMMLDSEGLLWIGTETGLNRFDGYNVRHIVGRDYNLANESIAYLYQDIDGSIWISTRFSGLIRLQVNEEQTEVIIPPEPNPMVYNEPGQVLSLNEDKLLIAMSSRVLEYDRQTGEITTVFTLPTEGEEYPHIRALAFNDEYIFIASSIGLYAMDRDTSKFVKINYIDFGISEHIINSKYLYLDQQSIWIGTVDGLVRLPLSFVNDAFIYPDRVAQNTLVLPNQNIWQILPDEDGLMLATDAGLMKVDWHGKNVVNLLNLTDSNLDVATSTVFSMVKDSNNRFWLATPSNGAVFWSPRHDVFDNFGLEQGLSDQTVWYFHEDKAINALWIGTENGLNKLDLTTTEIEKYVFNPKGPTYESYSRYDKIIPLPDGKLVLGSGKGMQIFDPDSSELTAVIGADNISSQRLSRFVWPALLNQNKIWMLDEEGLLTYDINTKEVDPLRALNSQLNGRFIYSVYPGRSHDEVFLTDGGNLLRYQISTGELTQWYSSGTHAADGSVFIDNFLIKDGLMWIAVNGIGLVAIDIDTHKVIQKFTAPIHFAENVIYGLQEDDEGNIWFSSHAGLYRLDVNSMAFTTFSFQQGLPANEFNAGAYRKLSDGRFVYGTVRGVALFRPSDLKANQVEIPEVHITDISMLSRALPEYYQNPGEHYVKLEHDDVGLTVLYSAFDFDRQSDIRYKLKLTGVQDIEYSETRNNKIVFPALSPGVHRLSIQTISPYTGELSKPVIVIIDVNYAPWSSPVAIGFYVLITLILLIIWNRRKSRQQALLSRAHSQALESQERMKLALAGSNSDVWDWRADKNLVQAKRCLDLSIGDSERVPLPLYIEAIHHEERDSYVTAWQEFIAQKTETFDVTYRIKSPEGKWLWFHDLGRVVSEASDGSAAIVSGTYSNVTNQFIQSRKARILGELFDQTNDCILVADEHGLVVSVNNAYLQTFGASLDDTLKLNVEQIDYFDQKLASFEWLKAAMNKRGHVRFEQTLVTGDSKKWTVIIDVSCAEDENKSKVYIFKMTDISALKDAQLKLKQMANYDSLTGLPNRGLLMDRIHHGIALSDRTNNNLALFFIDLDRFKQVNDSLGHDVGDQLLITVAERLKGCLRIDDTVARLGGDEFVIMLETYQSSDRLRHIALKVIDSVNESMEFMGQTVSVSPSIGIAIYPEDASNAADLMKASDVAMYHAKEKGRNNFQFFTPRMNIEADQRLQKENAIKLALENNEFINFYQPLVCAKSRKVIGVELLLRWQSKDGIKSPAEFISIAEDLNIIIRMTVEAIDRAFSDLNTWAEQGFEPTLSINISARHFDNSQLLQDLVSHLRKHRLAPQRINLEVTESVLLHDPDKAAEAMTALSDYGFNIHLDDFGTGYSSLSYLQKLPINAIKIDRSFIQNISIGEQNCVLVDSILALSKSLEIDCIAEGIEDESQAQYLLERNCQWHQGFMYSKPVPAEQIVTLSAALFDDKVSVLKQK